jgi:hypothetical protein
MSVDPSKQAWEPKDPQTWNRYAYARSNPLKYIDPDGEVFQRPEDTSAAEDFLIKLSIDSMTDVVPGTAMFRAGARPAGRLLGRAAQSLIRPVGSRLSARVPAVARLALKRVEKILKPGGQKLGTQLSGPRIRQLGGGLNAAKKLFGKLTAFFGKEVPTRSGSVRRVVLPGVGEVRLRIVQKGDDFVATIDVNIEGIGIREIKFLPE